MVNRDRLVNNFIEMVKVDSPSKKEREMANWLVNYLKERNIEAVIDNAGDKIGGNCGNLVVFRKSHMFCSSYGPSYAMWKCKTYSRRKYN